MIYFLCFYGVYFFIACVLSLSFSSYCWLLLIGVTYWLSVLKNFSSRGGACSQFPSFSLLTRDDHSVPSADRLPACIHVCLLRCDLHSSSRLHSPLSFGLLITTAGQSVCLRTQPEWATQSSSLEPHFDLGLGNGNTCPSKAA